MYDYAERGVSVESGCHGLGKWGPAPSEKFGGALADVADIAPGYVDDILIGTRRDNLTDSTKQMILKHDREVRLVMEQLLKHRLVASYNKAQLFRAIVEFCGHMSSGAVRKPAPGKLLVVARWVRPTTITALRGFLGFANYYSSYVRGYAGIVAPYRTYWR